MVWYLVRYAFVFCPLLGKNRFDASPDARKRQHQLHTCPLASPAQPALSRRPARLLRMHARSSLSPVESQRRRVGRRIPVRKLRSRTVLLLSCSACTRCCPRRVDALPVCSLWVPRHCPLRRRGWTGLYVYLGCSRFVYPTIVCLVGLLPLSHQLSIYAS